MVRIATSAKFPVSLAALADIGLFTNDEDVILTADATSGAATISVDDASAFAVGMWVPIRGVNGLEICQVTAVQLTPAQLTVSRAKDGTTAIAHVAGERGVAGLPAVALNQLRDEVIAIEAFLGINGDCIHWDRGLELEPSSDTCAILTLNLQSARTNKKFVAFKTDDVETGAILYDSANDAVEFQNIRVDIGTGSDILLEDNRTLRFGTSSNGRMLYDSADARVEYRSDADLRFETITGSTELLSITSAAIVANKTVQPRTTGTIDLGTRSLLWRDIFVGAASLHVIATAGDANDVYCLGTSGLQGGAGGASALDVTLARRASSDFLLTGALAGDVRLGMTGAATPRVSLRLATADANHVAALLTDRLEFGAGGASAVDYSLVRTAANTGTLSGTLRPSTDNAYDLGSTTLNWANAYLKRTAGSVLFMGASGLITESNAHFYWDNARDCLAIGDENGVTAQIDGGTTEGHLSVHDESGGANTADVLFYRHANPAAQSANVGYLRTRGTGGAPTIVVNGDRLSEVASYGYDGSDFKYATAIRSEVDGVPGNNDMPGRLVFLTTPDGSKTLSEALRIDNAQASIFSGHAKPTADNTLDLGTTALRWRQVYAAGITSGSILPSADNTYDLGSASFRWRDIYVTGSSLRVITTVGDANPTARLGSALLAFGAGGASATDIQYARQAASVVELTGSLAGSIRYGMSGAATPFLALRAAAADANALVQLGTTGISIGAGGASAADVSLTRSAANTLLLTASSSTQVSGAFIPSADNANNNGTSNRRWANVSGAAVNIFTAQNDTFGSAIIDSSGYKLGAGGASNTDILVSRVQTSMAKLTGGVAGDVRWGMSGAGVPFVSGRLATADANSAWHLGSDVGLSFGAGGATARDIFIERVVPTANKLVHVGAASTGTTGVWIDTTTPRIILKDAAGSPHFWAISVDTAGALVTTDLGTSLP